jgi:hypothetical protein
MRVILVFVQIAQFFNPNFVQNYLLTFSRNCDILLSESEEKIMTNKEITKAWNKFLDEECGCYTDEFGNRPCDYGAVCDRCMTVEKMKEFREKYLTNRK